MKVSVEKHFGEWSVSLVQGHQGFYIARGGTKAETLWMARMFRIALANHDEETRARSKKRSTSGH